MSSSVRTSGTTSHLYQSEWWMRLAAFTENKSDHEDRPAKKGFRLNLRWRVFLAKAMGAMMQKEIGELDWVSSKLKGQTPRQQLFG